MNLLILFYSEGRKRWWMLMTIPQARTNFGHIYGAIAQLIFANHIKYGTASGNWQDLAEYFWSKSNTPATANTTTNAAAGIGGGCRIRPFLSSATHGIGATVRDTI
ncbi:hypothetical protein EV702DRAFT_1040623 [Suillus placidus]|uniref:Uncharacterized protein n=1 Tax=Suillus placidus TaxID=48579 RepID=A0A9P7A852_9AGAM|nr:hypothetical protein EV702DRAFT_1040623 [Suillus placidus]